MQIQFTDSFKHNSFGFNQSHIAEAISNKDEVEKIDIDGKEIYLFKKEVLTGKTSFCWLIEAHPNGNILSVYSAFRIYPNLIEKIDELSPLQIFKNFVESFGLILKIGDQLKRIFIKETVFINNYVNGQSIVEIIDTNHHDFFSNFLVRIKKFSQRGAIAEIALAYCIDIGKYKSYLTNCKTNS